MRVFFQVPSDDETWPKRMEAACQVLESEFGVSLRTVHSGTKLHLTQKPISDRLKYFRQRLRTKTRPLSLSASKRPGLTVEDAKNTPQFGFGGVIYCNFGLFTAYVSCPLGDGVEQERLMAAIGDALEAHSSQYLPLPAYARLREVQFAQESQTRLVDRTPEEEGLPLIRECHYSGLEHPLQPGYLGWLNYWYKDVCAYVGFPERLQGHRVLDFCYPTLRGAWMVKLGSEPFVPRNPEQMVLLREMYQRLPRVGVRVSA